jgi:RibD C-terminal domain
MRDTIEFYSGDLVQFVNGRLRTTFHSIWFVGGGAVSAECLRLGLADEIRYSFLPILIGDGIPFFDKLNRDVALHLAEVKGYKSGMVELRYEVRGHPQRVNDRHLTTYVANASALFAKPAIEDFGVKKSSRAVD